MSADVTPDALRLVGPLVGIVGLILWLVAGKLLHRRSRVQIVEGEPQLAGKHSAYFTATAIRIGSIRTQFAAWEIDESHIVLRPRAPAFKNAMHIERSAVDGIVLQRARMGGTAIKFKVHGTIDPYVTIWVPGNRSQWLSTLARFEW